MTQEYQLSLEQHLGEQGRLVFVHNPHGAGELSGRNRWINSGVSWLEQETNFRVLELETRAGGWPKNSEYLATEGVSKNDIIVVRGGDGTLGDITAYAIENNIPVLTLPGGGECDGAYSQNPSWFRSPYRNNLKVFKKIIQTGRIATQPVIQMTVDDPNRTEKDPLRFFSPTGAGFGPDGRISHAINSSRHMIDKDKNRDIPPLFARYIRIAKSIHETLSESRPISVEITHIPNEKHSGNHDTTPENKLISGLTFIASRRLAGYGRFIIDPEGERAHLAVIGPGRIKMLTFVAQALAGRWPKDVLTDDTVVVRVLGRNVWAQANGDEIPIGENSTLTFRVHPNALRYVKAA